MSTNSADAIQHTPPAGWQTISNPNGSAYSNVNSNGGSCSIAVLPSISFEGYSEKDFADDWRTQVVAPFHVQETPNLQIETTSGGLQSFSASTIIQQSSQTAILCLIALSGNDRLVRIVTILDDEAYLPQLADFINSFRINESHSIPATPMTGLNNPIVESSSQSEKFGHMYYQPPKGWNVQKYSAALVISSSEKGVGIVLEIRILASVPFYGGLEQARNQALADALAGTPVLDVKIQSNPYYDITGGRKSFKGWDYIRFMARVSTSYQTFSSTIFLIHINNRIERIVVISSVPPQPHNEEKPYPDYDRYHDLVDEFIFSLKFDDWQEPLLPVGTLKGDGIVGVWRGISMFGGQLKAATAVFFSNGQAYFASKFPTRGLGGLNTLIESERNPRDWGAYQLQDGAGLLRMPYGEIPIELSEGQLILTTNRTQHRFIRLQSVDGAVFNGTYAFPSAHRSELSSISFTAEGRFDDHGAMNIMNHRTMDSPFMNVALQPGSGTYVLKDFTAMFSYDDGRVVKLAFLGEEFDRHNISPQKLVFSFNDDIITKQ